MKNNLGVSIAQPLVQIYEEERGCTRAAIHTIYADYTAQGETGD